MKATVAATVRRDDSCERETLFVPGLLARAITVRTVIVARRWGRRMVVMVRVVPAVIRLRQCARAHRRQGQYRYRKE